MSADTKEEILRELRLEIKCRRRYLIELMDDQMSTAINSTGYRDQMAAFTYIAQIQALSRLYWYITDEPTSPWEVDNTV